MAERGKTWSDAETAKLIEAWSEKTIQSHLLGAKRNAKAFEKIVQVLAAHNYERTEGGLADSEVSPPLVVIPVHNNVRKERLASRLHPQHPPLSCSVRQVPSTNEQRKDHYVLLIAKKSFHTSF